MRSTAMRTLKFTFFFLAWSLINNYAAIHECLAPENKTPAFWYGFTCQAYCYLTHKYNYNTLMCQGKVRSMHPEGMQERSTQVKPEKRRSNVDAQAEHVLIICNLDVWSFLIIGVYLEKFTRKGEECFLSCPHGLSSSINGRTWLLLTGLFYLSVF